MDGLYYLGALNLLLTMGALLAVAALWRREGSPRLNILPKRKNFRPIKHKPLYAPLVPSTMRRGEITYYRLKDKPEATPFIAVHYDVAREDEEQAQREARPVLDPEREILEPDTYVAGDGTHIPGDIFRQAFEIAEVARVPRLLLTKTKNGPTILGSEPPPRPLSVPPPKDKPAT